MGINYYAEAIDILETMRESSTKLMFEVAKKNPKAIVDAYSRIFGPRVADKILDMAKNGQHKIMCIKEYRTLTGAGLKEANEAVEKICKNYF